VRGVGGGEGGWVLRHDYLSYDGGGGASYTREKSGMWGI
jgi:hypothetical protein